MTSLLAAPSATAAAGWDAYRRAGLANATRCGVYRSSRALAVSDAVERLARACARYPILAARLRAGDDADATWIDGPAPFVCAETLPYAAADPRAGAMRRRAAARELDPRRGPVLRVELLDYADGRQDVVIAAHCLALDAASIDALAAFLDGDDELSAARMRTPFGATVQVDETVRDESGDDAPLPLEWADGAEAGPQRRESVRADLSGAGCIAEPTAFVRAVAAALRRRIGSPVVPLRVRQPRDAGDPNLGDADVLRVLEVTFASGGDRATMRERCASTAWDVEVQLAPAPASRAVVAVTTPSPALLAFALSADDDRPHVTCTYRADRIARAAAQDLVTEVARELAGAGGRAASCAAPELATAAPFDAGESGALIHDLVAQQAALRPHACAVVAPSGSLTYGELDARAEAVARGLRAYGVMPRQRVGVSVARDLGLVVALLGVLKAGASYVPLDPAYPPERLRFIADDADVAVVVADGARDALTRAPVVTLDALAAPPATPDDARSAGRPDDAAYVIYTSGSTGRPKGVVVEHRSVAALLRATRAELRFDEHDVWTCFHSVAFDFSVWEIWACLASGGRLVVVSEAVARAPDEFRELLRSEHVTVLNQTPSAFVMLLSSELPHPPELAVRLVIFGGEGLDSRVLLRWFDRYPEDRCRVVNMYGITETTVHCTWHTLTRRDALAGSRCVGTPLPGWSVHVLDADGQPAPAGVPGEIYVGGAGLARGYLARPGLTAQRFRADHLSGAPGRRLYRSGDRGRIRRDGRIEHLGRLDGQVKVRGYRIELDEIRACLLEDAGVHGAAVVLNRRGDAGDAHIDAYVVGHAANAAALRERLARALPAYMLPSTITVVPALPLTANGKLDAAKLPTPQAAPVPVLRDAAAGDAPQRQSLEASIARIWRDVLGVPVTLDDNFFLIGGNSLLAIRVVTRMRAENGASMSARTLYRNPTVRRLAAELA